MRGPGRWLIGSALLAGAAQTFLVTNLALAQLEADHDAALFHPGSDLVVDLDEGDERTIYLGAAESEALSFDWYPSDLVCTAAGPGDTTVPVGPSDDRRLVDGERRHMAVGRIEATSSGRHVLRCDDRAGRTDAHLLLARPARHVVDWVSPPFARFVFVASVVLGLAVGGVVGAVALDRRARRDRSERV